MKQNCCGKNKFLYKKIKSSGRYVAGALTLTFGVVLASGRYGDTYGELKKVDSSVGSSAYCPAGMVVIPSGHFTQGSFSGSIYKDRKFNSEVVGVASFCMDAAPIAVQQYKDFEVYAKAHPEGFSEKSRVDYDNEEEEEDDDEEEEDEGGVDNKQKKIEIITFEGVVVSPDRNAWKAVALDSDSSLYKFLDAMSNEYFDIDAYRSYPMVCVSHSAAELFTKWRTMKLADYREKEGLPSISPFRLPSAQEYDYASRGGAYQPVYSFGGPEPRRAKGEPLMNAKLIKGVFGEGGYFGPAPSGKFTVNAYGLYDMSGNVASWTSTNQKDENGVVLYTSMGGSWRMLSYFAQVGNIYTNYGEADCGIGIRCVVNMPINSKL